ncbi:MAG: nitrile hydratase subunit beta [Hyphomicrobiaceae bacterium]|nr:nitrile hydratase subunit beta [Hyphomicrobiaceae bacterium]
MGELKRANVLRRDGKGRAVHDVGGLDFGPIDRDEHELSLHEKRVDALLMLLTGPKRGAFKIDALRRAIEEYSEQEYDRTTYYEKWIRAIRNLLIEQEIVTIGEVEAKMAVIRTELEREGRAVSLKVIP